MELRFLWQERRHIPSYIFRALSVLIRKGPQEVFRKLQEYSPKNFHALDAEISALQLSKVAEGPYFTICIYSRNTQDLQLRESILSVVEQSYKRWELLLVFDGFEEYRNLADFLNIIADPRVHTVVNKQPKGFARSMNAAVKISTGKYFCPVRACDRMNQHALFYAALNIQTSPETDIIYSDHCIVRSKERKDSGPVFKPDWSPEYLYSHKYVGRFLIYRKALVMRLKGFDATFDDVAEFDLLLRLMEKRRKIQHIAKLLYHARMSEKITELPNIEYDQGAECLKRHLRRNNESFLLRDRHTESLPEVVFLPRRAALISVLIPTANGTVKIKNRIENHIDSVTRDLLHKTSYKNFEIIISHNGNLRPEQIDNFSKPPFRLVLYDKPEFNLAEKINMSANEARGRYLLLLNDDIRVIEPNWLEQMLGMIQRSNIGAVSPKLLFPNGNIQHAGIVLLGGCPGHPFHGEPDASGYGNGISATRNTIAVTGACQITPASLFRKLGGYDTTFPLDYNDVDYCLRARDLGYRSVYLSYARLFHYEGVSKDLSKNRRLASLEIFKRRWLARYPVDPYYNSNLSQAYPYRGM
jgi:O-antigen biosynthesis protein